MPARSTSPQQPGAQLGLACALILIFTAPLAGCGRAPRAGGDAGASAAPPAAPASGPAGALVARVGSGQVPLAWLKRRVELDAVEARSTGRPPREPRAILEALIEDELLVQQAIREGLLQTDPEVRELLVRRLLQKHDGAVAGQAGPTPDELKRYYDMHRDQFPDEDRLRVRHILVKVPPDATAALVETLKRKADGIRQEAAKKPDGFVELAVHRSEDISASRGGELGYLPLGRWVVLFGPEFPAAQATVGVGQVGPVVRSRQGFHVFQIVERKEKGADPLTVQRREITARYLAERRSAARTELMAKLKRELPVEVDRQVLDSLATPRTPAP